MRMALLLLAVTCAMVFAAVFVAATVCVHAVIARTPVVGGTVASFDAAAALKVPGVEKVVKIEGTPARMVDSGIREGRTDKIRPAGVWRAAHTRRMV